MGDVMTGLRTNSGARLLRQWKIPVIQAMYHKDGNFFMPLERFPGAYCDPNGYVIFPTQTAFDSCKYISIGTSTSKRIHVPGGVSSLPGYVRAE